MIARLYQLVDARAAEAGDPYRGGYANRERLQLLLPSALNHFCLRRAVARERTKLRSLSRKSASIAGINSTIGSSTPSADRSEEHTSELQSLMRNSYAVFCLKKIISSLGFPT